MDIAPFTWAKCPSKHSLHSSWNVLRNERVSSPFQLGKVGSSTPFACLLLDKLWHPAVSLCQVKCVYGWHYLVWTKLLLNITNNFKGSLTEIRLTDKSIYNTNISNKKIMPELTPASEQALTVTGQEVLAEQPLTSKWLDQFWRSGRGYAWDS